MQSDWNSFSLQERSEWIQNPESTYLKHRFALSSFDLGVPFLCKALFAGPGKNWAKIGFQKMMACGRIQVTASDGGSLPRRDTSTAVVIVFGPDQGSLENLRRLSREFSNLIIVDNSRAPVKDTLGIETFPGKAKIHYFYNGNHYSLAGAINLGLRAFLKDNPQGWVFFFDQDTTIVEDYVDRIATELEGETPQQLSLTLYGTAYEEEMTDGDTHQKLLSIRDVITSGSFLTASAAKQLGLYHEDLYIDSLDHEYSLRAWRSGMEVKLVTKKLMSHKLGVVTTHSLLWKKSIIVRNHSPFRWYFFTRNFIYVAAEGLPWTFLWIFTHGIGLFKAWAKMIIFEKRKSEKLVSSMIGLVDGMLLFFGIRTKRRYHSFR